MTKVKGVSQIEKMKVPLESESLLTTTYWFVVIIVCFTFVGLGWDYWVYRKTSRADRYDPDQQGLFTDNFNPPAVFILLHGTVDNVINIHQTLKYNLTFQAKNLRWE